jgi:RND family efflux transporter MFP subunit
MHLRHWSCGRPGPRASRWSLASLILCTSGLSLTCLPQAWADGSADPVAEVRVLGPIDDTLVRAFAGTRAVTRPSQDANMGFQTSTTIKEVIARPGTEVAKGQLVLRGDDGEDSALLKLQQIRVENPLAVDRAKAAMELADVEYKRLKEIFDKGGSAPLEVERARLSYEAARIDWEIAKNQQSQEVIQLERLQSRVERVRLAAPFDGVVDSVSVDVGQIVKETQEIVRIVRVDPLWVDVNAPTQDAKTLSMSPGAQAWILCDVAGTAKLTMGTVVEIAPTADSSSRTRRIRVQVENKKGEHRLLAGEPVWVRFSEPDAKLAAAK